MDLSRGILSVPQDEPNTSEVIYEDGNETDDDVDGSDEQNDNDNDIDVE